MEVSQKVKEHLKRLHEKEAFGSKIGYDEIVHNWSQKEELLSSQIHNLKMKEVPKMEGSAHCGVLGITYSGSLLALYVPQDSERAMEYVSIKLRTDVPDFIKDESVLLQGDVCQDQPVRFSKGKLEHSSPLYRIAVTPEDLTPAEQNRRLSEAMIYLSNSFLKVNQNTFHPSGDAPEQFTKRNMVAFMAKKYGLTQQITRDLLDDYFTLIETGILMGESISLGRVGRLKAKKKNAQKARVIKSPLDGGEITVAAKPAVMIPKISFSDYFKDRVASLPAEEE